MPVSTPVAASIVAIVVGVTLHIPPLTASVSVIAAPDNARHIDGGPPIAGGTGFTVTTAIAGQPVPGLVVVIVAVPYDTPVTTPADDTTATPVLLLDHELPPPPRLLVEPTHTSSKPLIAGGAAFTVTVTDAAHPVGSRYVIVVVPGATPPISPVVTPVVVAVAIDVLLLIHAPPPVVSVSVIVIPWHSGALSRTGDSAFTIMLLITLHPGPVVYDTSTVPEDTPHKTPVLLIVASDDGPVDHVPPVELLNSTEDEPAHTIGLPVIAGGGGNTVINLLTVQPEPREYCIVAKPADIPHTIPLVEFTVATAVLLLVHVPPLVPSVSGVHDPTHTLPEPPMPTGGAVTVNTELIEHPEGGVYVTVVVPGLTPVIIPEVAGPNVATDRTLLLHVPPAGVELSVDVEPAHAWAVPMIEPGKPFTVTTTDFVQPDPNEYVIVAVPAIAPPHTIPLRLPTDATVVLLVVHVPPEAVSNNGVHVPAHICVIPVIIDGARFTVTVTDALQPTGVVYVIIAVPGITPCTVPPLTVAIVVLPLDHTPPGVRSVNIVVEPTHRPVLPPIPCIGFTVTVFGATQLPPSEYVIVTVPPVGPLIAPHTLPSPSTVAIVVLLLTHVPPVIPSVRVINEPAHTDDAPLSGVGAEFTVTVTEAVQPPNVYVIVEVPGVVPVVTVPPATDTTELLLVQLPPPTASVSTEVAPPHRFTGPRIGAGDAVTVITRVTVQPEPPKEYVIVTGLGNTPVTVPAAVPVDTTVAINVEEELHDPPAGRSFSTVVAPTHTVAAPVIGPGEELTVTTVVAVQPPVVV
jgi:hypothetical protein